MATLGEIVRATGRRKESVARVRIVPGSGRFALNGRSLEDYFPRPALQMVLARGIASRAHFFQTEIKFYCSNLNIIEVPITYKAASPRLSTSSLSEAFRQLWRLYRSRKSRGAV